MMQVMRVRRVNLGGIEPRGWITSRKYVSTQPSVANPGLIQSKDTYEMNLSSSVIRWFRPQVEPEKCLKWCPTTSEAFRSRSESSKRTI